MGATFKTNPYGLHELLPNCHKGTLQLPDFQRSWVWDEDRIKSLIASVSRAFPVGALMTLETGGPVNFKPRPVEGAPRAQGCEAAGPAAGRAAADDLALSGHAAGKVVETVTPKNKKVKRGSISTSRRRWITPWTAKTRSSAVPEDEARPRDFGREVVLDLSTPEKEFESLMYPVSQVFDWDDWQDGFDELLEWRPDTRSVREEFRTFKKQVLENFKKLPRCP